MQLSTFHSCPPITTYLIKINLHHTNSRCSGRNIIHISSLLNSCEEKIQQKFHRGTRALGSTSPRCRPVCFGFGRTIVRGGKDIVLVIVLSTNVEEILYNSFYSGFYWSHIFCCSGFLLFPLSLCVYKVWKKDKYGVFCYLCTIISIAFATKLVMLYVLPCF